MVDPADHEAVIREARVPSTSVFFLGCFASRVTLLSQQRRALNLVDAILAPTLSAPTAASRLSGPVRRA
jgi:hypothetical protein